MRDTQFDEHVNWFVHGSVMVGYSELMRLLIYSGFNPRQKDNYLQTPLHLACINGNLTAVRELCEQVGCVYCLSSISNHWQIDTQLTE